jgi:hypothetical protein
MDNEKRPQKWREQRDSNPQPTDLESAALPISAILPQGLEFLANFGQIDHRLLDGHKKRER